MMAFFIWLSAISAGPHLIDFNTAVGLHTIDDTFNSGLIHEDILGLHDVPTELTIRTQNFLGELITVVKLCSMERTRALAAVSAHD